MVLILVALPLLITLVFGPAQAAEPSDVTTPWHELPDVQLDEAKALIRSGQPAEALTRLAEVQARADASGDSDLLAVAFTVQSAAHHDLGDWSASLQSMQAASSLLCVSTSRPLREQCARSLLSVGEKQSALGQPEALPQLEKAIRQAQADVRPDLEASALNALGEALWARDELAEAERRHQEALDVATQSNDVGPQVVALIGLGTVALTRGDLPEAEARQQAALDLSKQHSLLYSFEAVATLELGRVWAQQGRLEDAEAALQRALAHFERYGMRMKQAEVMILMAGLALDRDEIDRAKHLYQQALTLKTEVGDAYGRVRALVGLGVALAPKKAGRVEAEKRLEEAHSLALAIGSRSGEAEALRGLGTVWLKQYRAAQAADTFKRALEIYVALGIPHGQVRALLDLASAQFELVEPQDMVQSCEQALMIATRHGLQPLVNRAGIQLTEALRLRSAELRFQKDWAQAEAVWRQSMEIAAQTGDPTLVSTGYKGLAELLARQGRLAEAEAAYMKTIELLTITDELFLLPFVWLTLSDLAAAQGRLPEAEAHMRRAVEGMAEGMDKPGVGRNRVFALLTLAALQSDLGMLEEAEKTYETSVVVAASLSFPDTEVEARVSAATFLAGQGKPAAARATLEPCRTRAQSSDRETERVELEIACLAAMSEAQRSPRAAKRSALQLVAVAEAASDVLWQASTLIHLARAHQRLGDPEEAEAALLLAIREADRRREAALRAEALTLLAELLDARGETAEAEAARAAAAAP